MNNNAFLYTLHLADNALMLTQRNTEWTGHGPVLEQDIAITNIALDLLGQSRNLFAYAAERYNSFSDAEKKEVEKYIPQIWKSHNRELQEDDLAMLRIENQYLNLLVTELPRGDWAFTVLRQAFFSHFQQLQYEALLHSGNETLAAIAEKSLKEVAYHIRWSSEWVIRLGDGTEESHQRIATAFHQLWPYTGEFFVAAPFEDEASLTSMKETWLQKIETLLEGAGLSYLLQQNKSGLQQGGKWGRHTEHLGYLLTELQYMQRTYPNSVW